MFNELASLAILQLLGKEDRLEGINYSKLLCPGQCFVRFKWINPLRNKKDETTSLATMEIITKAYAIGVSFKWHTSNVVSCFNHRTGRCEHLSESFYGNFVNLFVSLLWLANKLRTDGIGIWMADMGTQWKFHYGEKIRTDKFCFTELAGSLQVRGR